MNNKNLGWCISLLLLMVATNASGAQAQVRKLDGPSTIRLVTLSKQDRISPRSGGLVFDSDGIGQSQGAVVVSPFTLKTVVGGDTVEVSIPEFQVDQVSWVVDPIGCVDDDPKTKCHPTWGTEYSGQVGGDLPVSVEFANGSAFSPYGIASLFLNVTVIDDRVRTMEGYIQITYSVPTDLPNYRILVSGRLR